ncbi:hypothetical protein F5144DRAFT_615450 [Chaetomium tenue]|uniref:Uncharacterized protein n=1 Tax=Chaetomium tenue TaxID=1854479 RepID=A0ACB7NZX3_9PEZI|nr:hypothetical protein F5144DRAFT_615450 [Chaetomium globosum]
MRTRLTSRPAVRFTSAANPAAVRQRLSCTDYDDDACRAALRGEAVPWNLGNNVARCALVSGIRHHVELARSAEVGELEKFPGQEIFGRARNARRIMSNRIPPAEAMEHEDLYPYCIWYPDLATEATYEHLAMSYPDLRYQIGRACAVAGYDQLYHKLNLLPDVSIAEEARENHNNPGAQRIYQHIMAAPVRYRVMDDTTLTIHLHTAPPSPAFLNGDTAVVSTLPTLRRAYTPTFHPDPHYPNLTEDWHITEVSPPATEPPILTPAAAALFYTPLPPDLPTLSKTLLTLHAAATGNVDRYARLRTREVLPLAAREQTRGVRFEVGGGEDEDGVGGYGEGGYGDAGYAGGGYAEGGYAEGGYAAGVNKERDGEESDDEKGGDEKGGSGSDDPIPVPDAELPYWIWRPTHPPADVLQQLAQARPVMRSQCVRACIAAGYRKVYDAIMNMEPAVLPDKLMMAEAKAAGDGGRYYRKDLAERAEDLGLNVARLPLCKGYEHWMEAPSPWERERRFLSREEAYRREKLGLGRG